MIEEIIMKTTDRLAPMVEFMDNVSKESQAVPPIIKRKLCLRKRILTKQKQSPNEVLKGRINNLNTEIKIHFVLSI